MFGGFLIMASIQEGFPTGDNDGVLPQDPSGQQGAGVALPPSEITSPITDPAVRDLIARIADDTEARLLNNQNCLSPHKKPMSPDLERLVREIIVKQTIKTHLDRHYEENNPLGPDDVQVTFPDSDQHGEEPSDPTDVGWKLLSDPTPRRLYGVSGYGIEPWDFDFDYREYPHDIPVAGTDPIVPRNKWKPWEEQYPVPYEILQHDGWHLDPAQEPNTPRVEDGPVRLPECIDDRWAGVNRKENLSKLIEHEPKKIPLIDYRELDDRLTAPTGILWGYLGGFDWNKIKQNIPKVPMQGDGETANGQPPQTGGGDVDNTGK